MTSARASVSAPAPAVPTARTSRPALIAAQASWIGLLALCVAWEWRLAPLRPGGSWLILKALVPLLLLPGLLRADAKSMQWALLWVLAYIAEGVVRVFDAGPAATMAWLEISIGGIFFAAALIYLRPLARAAKQAKRDDAAARADR